MGEEGRSQPAASGPAFLWQLQLQLLHGAGGWGLHRARLSSLSSLLPLLLSSPGCLPPSPPSPPFITRTPEPFLGGGWHWRWHPEPTTSVSSWDTSRGPVVTGALLAHEWLSLRAGRNWDERAGLATQGHRVQSPGSLCRSGPASLCSGAVTPATHTGKANYGGGGPASSKLVAKCLVHSQQRGSRPHA